MSSDEDRSKPQFFAASPVYPSPVLPGSVAPRDTHGITTRSERWVSVCEPHNEHRFQEWPYVPARIERVAPTIRGVVVLAGDRNLTYLAARIAFYALVSVDDHRSDRSSSEPSAATDRRAVAVSVFTRSISPWLGVKILEDDTCWHAFQADGR
jgi:hypothetical protein